MTKDKRRAKRRLWRCVVGFIMLFAVCTVTLAAQYPERTFAPPEVEQAEPEPPAPADAVEPPVETIPEIVSEAEETNLDADPVSVEVAPETISPPAEEEVIALAYAPKPEMTTETPAQSGDRELLAQVIEREAGNQSLKGRIGVGNVVMNRVASAFYPDTIYDVLYQYDDRYGGWQFSTAPYLESTTPSELSYEAADAVLAGQNVLPGPENGKLVVFFSRAGENDDVAIIIEDHVFCYSYRAEP